MSLKIYDHNRYNAYSTSSHLTLGHGRGVTPTGTFQIEMRHVLDFDKGRSQVPPPKEPGSNTYCGIKHDLFGFWHEVSATLGHRSFPPHTVPRRECLHPPSRLSPWCVYLPPDHPPAAKTVIRTEKPFRETEQKAREVQVSAR